MKTLVLGPEEVREALDPKNNPKRHVFLVAVDGMIVCSDIDEGWLCYVKPKNVKNKEWCLALRAAISSMQHQILLAKSIHDNLKETTEPEIRLEGLSPPKVFVYQEGTCPVCWEKADPGFYPFCSELHARHERRS